MPSLKKNMKARISVLITGQWLASGSPQFQVAYSLQSSVPNPKTGTSLVDPGGDIDLRNIDPGNDYVNATDIEIFIAPNSTWTDSSGTKMNLVFPLDGSAITFTDATPGTEFELHDTKHADKVSFTDLDDGSGEYGYCLNVNSQYPNDPRIFPFSLDPQIINKGTGGHK